jgi:hypothetical protein
MKQVPQVLVSVHFAQLDMQDIQSVFSAFKKKPDLHATQLILFSHWAQSLEQALQRPVPSANPDLKKPS